MSGNHEDIGEEQKQKKKKVEIYNKKRMKEELGIKDELICPECGEPIYRVRVIYQGKDSGFFYADHRDGRKWSTHYLGPAHAYKVANDLDRIVWLVEHGFLTKEDYLSGVRAVLNTLKNEDITNIDDIAGLLLSVLSSKVSNKEDVKRLAGKLKTWWADLLNQYGMKE